MSAEPVITSDETVRTIRFDLPNAEPVECEVYGYTLQPTDGEIKINSVDREVAEINLYGRRLTISGKVDGRNYYRRLFSNRAYEAEVLRAVESLVGRGWIGG